MIDFTVFDFCNRFHEENSQKGNEKLSNGIIM